VKNDKKIVYIIYPNTIHSLERDIQAMAELVINSFFDSKKDIIRFSINNKAKLVESNDKNIKGILDILLKAGNLERIEKLLVSLLHKDSELSTHLGILRCLISDKEINYIIKGIKPSPDFSWEVRVKSMV
jgi:hypothetical protein